MEHGCLTRRLLAWICWLGGPWDAAGRELQASVDVTALEEMEGRTANAKSRPSTPASCQSHVL